MLTSKDKEPTLIAADENQYSLLKIFQLFLKAHDIVLSENAILDLPDNLSDDFNAVQVISALKRLHFDCSYGKVRLAKLIRLESKAPICFDREGQPFLFSASDTDNLFKITKIIDDQFVAMECSKSDFKKLYSGFVILAAKRDDTERLDEEKNWFFGSLSKGRSLYLQVILAAVISSFLGLATSLFIMVVYDRVVPNEAINSLLVLTIGVVIALCFDFLIKLLRAHFIDQAGKLADERMSRLLFDKIARLDTVAQSKQSGALAGVVREFDTLREFFTSATLVAIVDLPFVFFFIWIINLIAGPLSLVPMIAVPIVLISSLLVQPFMAQIASKSMDSSFNKQGVLAETLHGLETIQATGSEKLMRRRYQTAATSQSNLGLKSRFLSQFTINIAASVQQFAQVGTIFYGVFLIRDDVITMGAMIAAVILGGKCLAPLTQLAQAMTRANSARQAYKNLSLLFSSGANTKPRVGNLSRGVISGFLEFQNVNYSFPEAQSPTLIDISLRIPAGQKVAIVGKMGSGKSTFLRLAAGLMAPSSGAVMVDGIDMRQLNEADLRRNIGVMLQESWLFSGTVRENLQLGFSEYSDEHIIAISKVSGLDDFISRVPNGYELVLKEKGAGLSGGQRQSINLARSLLHNPPILVLDEPTSSMDASAEKNVIKRLKEWSSEKTALIVTHRKPIFELCDRVIVFEDGKITSDTSKNLV